MKTWQIIALVIVGFLAVVGLFIFAIFRMTSGVADAGDEFFEAAGAGDYAAAYALTSQDLQRQNTLEGLGNYIEANGFDEVVETSWSSRSINNNTGSLAGSLTTETGGTIPVEMGLVNEAGGWKINYISRQNSGLGGAGGGPTAVTVPNIQRPDIAANVPRDANPAHLLFLNGGGFISSMEDGDFDFWRLRWVEGTTGSELAERYPRTPELVEKLVALERVRPRLQSARMNDDGQLEVVGVSDGADNDLVMNLALDLEGDRWKLSDFRYELR